MRVCFLLPSLARSGGSSVVRDCALRLSQRPSVESELVLTAGEPPASGRVQSVPIRTLPQARGQRYELAVATWWETARALWELNADRRVCFLQSFEQRFYHRDELVEQLGAEAILALPVDFIVVAGWMRELLLELRPEANVVHVPNGVDAEVFAVPQSERGDRPLRVLIEGQPSLWFKGVQDAVQATRAMDEPAELTLLALDPPMAEGLDVDRIVGDLDPSEVAALYAETDVLVKLSRVESLGLPPLEAMYAGLPSVVTPFTGHEEYLEHGVNGIVVGFDDLAGTARWLDLLAGDRALLERLSGGARATAAAWPSPGATGELFVEALTRIVAAPPPAPDPRLLQRTLALHGELGRDQAGRLRYTEAALTSARAHVGEVSAMVNERSAELVALKSTRSYRLHRAAARLAGLVRR